MGKKFWSTNKMSTFGLLLSVINPDDIFFIRDIHTPSEQILGNWYIMYDKYKICDNGVFALPTEGYYRLILIVNYKLTVPDEIVDGGTFEIINVDDSRTLLSAALPRSRENKILFAGQVIINSIIHIPKTKISIIYTGPRARETITATLKSTTFTVEYIN